MVSEDSVRSFTRRRFESRSRTFEKHLLETLFHTGTRVGGNDGYRNHPWHGGKRQRKFRCSIVVSISACHAEDPGSIPGGGFFFFFPLLSLSPASQLSRCATCEEHRCEKQRCEAQRCEEENAKNRGAKNRDAKNRDVRNRDAKISMAPARG